MVTLIYIIPIRDNNVQKREKNDEGQKKYKEKCKDILNSVNAVAYCISDVRGCSCK